MIRERTTALGLAVLALCTYVPALASSPGRMPADTKLYLYLDPGGLLGRSASTFEPDQFAGWVPHQQITYLWPSGPWFWLFDAVGVPDWIAHRLWIGTILFVAGAGTVWAARQVGLAAEGAVAAGFVYAFSPFLLAYVSRTSLLLLPWAGLGWIVGLTVRATLARLPSGVANPCEGTAGWRRRLDPWREPALIALVVATIGSANATALAMIAPAPVLWLASAAWTRVVPFATAVGIAARTGVLCVLVSAWWIAMLVVQARHGADVLAFSETLEDVSRNSTGSEVLRSLGYWLFYQRDPFGPTTTASLPYLVSSITIATSFVVVIVGLAGIALLRWPVRGFAASCVAVGAVLAVGVHPYGNSSPLMSLVGTDEGSGLALALRSSTRSVPVLVFGVALGVAAVVGNAPGHHAVGRGPRPVVPVRLVVASLVALLAVVNLPALRTRALVDPVIDRDADPPRAWIDAATTIDSRSGDGRVLQLPGAEFGAFRWGYTADQPLVGLGDTPLVTRDLLPLGSPAAMDLLFALDDRFQAGVAEPAAVAPIARLLGATTVLVTNDMEFERYRTPRPEIVDALLTGDDAVDLVGLERFGEPIANIASMPMVDPAALDDARIGTPLSPLAVLDVDDPRPVIRAKTEVIVVSGSGDGLVDAAAAGLIDGTELIRYSASINDELGDLLADAGRLVVTDSNRDRAHHWRGSQDVHGHTEPGGPEPDVLVFTPSDQRLPVFEGDDADTQTVAEQVGNVRARASAYGEPFAYRPEHRAVMAIDGDPDTAWVVGDHGEPVGERIRLELTSGTTLGDTLVLHQVPPSPGGRSITEVTVQVDRGAPWTMALDERSYGAHGQAVADARLAGASVIEFEISAVSVGDAALASSRAGVGFVEIDTGLAPTSEVIRAPIDALAVLDDNTKLDVVFTRLRSDPTDPWRSDPEPVLRRRLTLPSARTMAAAVTLRLDRRTSDELLAELLPASTTSALADRRLTGSTAARGASATDGDTSTAWITPFDGAVGATLRFTVTAPMRSFTLVQPPDDISRITSIIVTDDTSRFEVPVPVPDDRGMSAVDLPGALDAGEVSLAIATIESTTTVDRRYGDTVELPAAIAEIAADDLVVAAARDDDEVIAAECAPGLLSIDGVDVGISYETTIGELVAGDAFAATICGGPVELSRGDHLIEAANRGALTVDRLVLTDGPDPDATGTIDEPVVAIELDSTRSRRVQVSGCVGGCWIVLGEGLNAAWRASTAGIDLGEPQLVDGGFNGWLLPPSDGAVTVSFTWTAQTPVTWGLVISAVSALVLAGVAGIAILTPRRTRSDTVGSDDPALRLSTRTSTLIRATALVVAPMVLIAPAWALPGLAVAVADAGARCFLTSRWWAGRVPELVGLLTAAAVAVSVVVIERRHAPYPNAGWTIEFEQLNGAALFALVVMAVGAVYASRGPSRSG